MAALSIDCCLGLVSPVSSDCITRQEEQLAKKNVKLNLIQLKNTFDEVFLKKTIWQSVMPLVKYT